MLIALLIVLAMAVAAALLLLRPRIEAYTPQHITNDATPLLVVHIEHPLGVQADRVRAQIDGERVATHNISVRDGGARVRVQAPYLADGQHRIQISIDRVGVLQRTLTQTWTLTVDTQPPVARILAPVTASAPVSPYADARTVVVTKLPFAVNVAVEAGSSVQIGSDAAGVDDVELAASGATTRHARLSLPQGAQQLRVVVQDAAGNTTERTQYLLVDTTAPRITLQAPRVVRDASLQLPVAGRDPHGIKLVVALDGHAQDNSVDERTSTVPATPAGQGGSEILPVVGAWTIALAEPAYEGRHTLQVTATDSLGNTRTITRTIIIDSGEHLGEVTGLRAGARGGDVLELHTALVKAGVATRAQLAPDARARTYGAATKHAVQAFQAARGMDTDGVAGPDTIAGLTLKIVIDRSTKQLTLYRNGQVVKTWGVAVGSPEYPTPAGEFKIQSMQENPTWTPPDSAWAKGAKVIGPGPDNPLGTRWMGINGTVGIHGTNNPASIGYSVSHGCIRMRIPDVEELFGMVSIGTPVTVL